MRTLLAAVVLVSTSLPAFAQLNRNCTSENGTKIEIADRDVSRRISINGSNAEISSVSDNGEMRKYHVNNLGTAATISVNLFTGEIVLQDASGDSPLTCL